MSKHQNAWTRRLKLLQLLLHRGHIATRQAAHALGVDRRRALDDLGTLEQHGVPIYPDGEGQDRVWRLQESWRRLGLSLGIAERLSLRFGSELLASFLGQTDLGDAMTGLDRQVGIMATETDTIDPTFGRQFIYVREPEKDYRAHRATIAALVDAIVGSYRVTLTYRHARSGDDGGLKIYPKTQPLTLAIYKRGLYVLAQRRDVVSIHAVERIEAIEAHPMLRFDYPRPSEYDPAKMLSSRLGLVSSGDPPSEVRLRFSANVRPYAEARRWMPHQR
ncbi:MAG: putative DNA-binding transcriptional regulator YafY, partial [Myxococcota bacterium]